MTRHIRLYDTSHSDTSFRHLLPVHLSQLPKGVQDGQRPSIDERQRLTDDWCVLGVEVATAAVVAFAVLTALAAVVAVPAFVVAAVAAVVAEALVVAAMVAASAAATAVAPLVVLSAGR